MKWRRWAWLLVGLAVLAGLDTAAWWTATRMLRQRLAAWAADQAAAGLAVDLGQPVATGWPFAAALRLDALRVGLPGKPPAMIAALVLDVAPTHPSTVQARIIEVTAADVVAQAAEWRASIPFAHPDHGESTAHDVRLNWSGHAIAIDRLTGSLAATPDGVRLTLQADGVELARSGVRLPPSLGSRVGTSALQADWHGRLMPQPSATGGFDGARQWRESGGAIDVAALSASYGPMQANLRGRIGLDAALRPAGDGVLTVRGLLAVLQALASAGIVPPGSAVAARGVLTLLGGGDDGPVELPVQVADGVASVARFPLARLPALLPWEQTSLH